VAYTIHCIADKACRVERNFNAYDFHESECMLLELLLLLIQLLQLLLAIQIKMMMMTIIIIINMKPRVGYANVYKYVGKVLSLQFALQ
jgi:hypothetical protein